MRLQHPHLFVHQLRVGLGNVGHVAGQRDPAVAVEIAEHGDRLRGVGLVAKLVEIFDDAVNAVLGDGERLAADAPEHRHLGFADRPVGEDHAKQQQQLRRQHRVVGDLAHAGVAVEHRYDIIEQSLQHAFPRRCNPSNLTRNAACASRLRASPSALDAVAVLSATRVSAYPEQTAPETSMSSSLRASEPDLPFWLRRAPRPRACRPCRPHGRLLREWLAADRGRRDGRARGAAGDQLRRAVFDRAGAQARAQATIMPALLPAFMPAMS